MSTSLETTIAAPVARRPAPQWRKDRVFFTGMAIVAAFTVFVGFAPTYFLKALFGAPTLSPLLHVHGLLFTSWIVLLAAQTALVAGRRTDMHRRLGLAGGVLVVAMVVVGTAAALASARRGFTPPGGPPPLVFLAIPLGDLVIFATLIGLGLYFRQQSRRTSGSCCWGRSPSLRRPSPAGPTSWLVVRSPSSP